MQSNPASRRFPRGLYLFFTIEGCFMFALSMLNATLVLYLTHNLNIPLEQAYTIYAAFGALFFSSSLLGGYLGGRYDYKLAIIVGTLLAGFGSYFVAIPKLPIILAGLSCFIVGGGMVIPNITCIISRMFSKNDSMRDSGFTIVYIGMNIGGFISAIVSGFIANALGYEIDFIISSTVLLCILFIFLRWYHIVEFHHEEQVIPYEPNLSLANLIPILIAVAIFVPVVIWLLNHAAFSNKLLIAIGIIMIGIVSIYAMKEKGLARRRLFGFLIFIVLGVAFWSLYMLAPSALTIFIDNNVDRHIGHFLVPTSSIYSLNPFFILALGTLTTLFFLNVGKKGKRVELPAKFGIGITSMGLGYLVLILAILDHNSLGYIALIWIVLSYFLQTFGELFIGPIGFAMVGSLVPTQLEGMMTGVFQLSTGVSGAISGFLASATVQTNTASQHNPLLTNHTFLILFGMYGAISVAIGLAILLLRPVFNRLWN